MNSMFHDWNTSLQADHQIYDGRYSAHDVVCDVQLLRDCVDTRINCSKEEEQNI